MPGTNALMFVVMVFVVKQRSSMSLGYKLLTTMRAEKSLYNHVWLVTKNGAAVIVAAWYSHRLLDDRELLCVILLNSILALIYYTFIASP
jgi:hypothetical protein